MTAAARKPKQEPEIRSYSDWLKANRKSREWKIEPTEKRFGDLIITSRGVERLG